MKSFVNIVFFAIMWHSHVWLNQWKPHLYMCTVCKVSSLNWKEGAPSWNTVSSSCNAFMLNALRNGMWKTYLSRNKVLDNQSNLQTSLSVVFIGTISVFLYVLPHFLYTEYTWVYITADHFLKHTVDFNADYFNITSTCRDLNPCISCRFFSEVMDIKTICVKKKKKPSRSVLFECYWDGCISENWEWAVKQQLECKKRPKSHCAFNDIHVCFFSCFFPGRIFWQHSSECSAVRQQSLKSGIL